MGRRWLWLSTPNGYLPAGGRLDTVPEDSALPMWSGGLAMVAWGWCALFHPGGVTHPMVWLQFLRRHDWDAGMAALTIIPLGLALAAFALGVRAVWREGGGVVGLALSGLFLLICAYDGWWFGLP